jgi:transcriptional regulator with XRE-family HTH domain
MAVSTILQQHRDPPLAEAIGRELRRRRQAAGMTQATVGVPFTRAFVSAVERGRVVPSIPALAVLLSRLDVGFEDFFRGVQSQMTLRYTAGHGDCQEAASGRRR